MTVDPVVVTPDIASKNESVNDMSRSLKANGSAANSAISTQQVDVSTKVCRRPRRSGPCRFVNTSSTPANRSEEHTSELQSLMRISYAVFCLKTKKKKAQRN